MKYNLWVYSSPAVAVIQQQVINRQIKIEEEEEEEDWRAGLGANS